MRSYHTILILQYVQLHNTGIELHEWKPTACDVKPQVKSRLHDTCAGSQRWSLPALFNSFVGTGIQQWSCATSVEVLYRFCPTKRTHTYIYIHTLTTVPYQVLSRSHYRHIQDSHVKPVSSSNTRWIQVRCKCTSYLGKLYRMTKVLGAVSACDLIWSWVVSDWWIGL